MQNVLADIVTPEGNAAAVAAALGDGCGCAVRTPLGVVGKGIAGDGVTVADTDAQEGEGVGGRAEMECVCREEEV